MNHIPPRLAPYVPIANLIGAATGPQVEVVLHDTSSPLHSVVYVVNGHVTGRKVGQTFEHLFSDELKERASNGDLIDNYYFKVQGRTIRSSSLLLRGEDGRVFGAICINVDVTKITDAIRDLSALLPGFASQRSAGSMQGAAAPAVPSVGSEFIGSMLDSLPDRPTRRERLELIAFLEKKNVFAMRGALDLVATRLGVANVTVYSDIRYVKTHPEEFATS